MCKVISLSLPALQCPIAVLGILHLPRLEHRLALAGLFLLLLTKEMPLSTFWTTRTRKWTYGLVAGASNEPREVARPPDELAAVGFERSCRNEAYEDRDVTV